MLNIRPLSRERLASLMENAAVIEADKKGIKVAVLPDGQYLKFFYRKRFLSRELLAPAAVKFARNAYHLTQLDIPTLQVKALHRFRLKTQIFTKEDVGKVMELCLNLNQE